MPRLRFTLRVALAFTAIVAIVTWRQSEWIKQRRAALDAGLVAAESTPLSPQPRAPGLLWLIGEDGYAVISISHFPGGNGADYDRLASLFPEAVPLESFPTPKP